MNEEQIDFIKAYNMLTEDEKAEMKSAMTEDESAAIQKLQEEYDR